MFTGIEKAWTKSLPIGVLAPGEVAPPMNPDHPSWHLLEDWDDPMAPRALFKVASLKQRIDTPNGPAIEFWGCPPQGHGWDSWDRALLTGKRTWRDYSLCCRLRAEQQCIKNQEPSYTGLLFRVITSRQYYCFCIEAAQRLVLYRRNDDDWTSLGSWDADTHSQIITLEVQVNGNQIDVVCPEYDIVFSTKDNEYDHGEAGFIAYGQCQLFDLEIQMTKSQQQANAQAERDAEASVARLAKTVPSPIHVGKLKFEPGSSLIACCPITSADRHDLLFKTPKGLAVKTWSGRTLWRFDGPVSTAKCLPATTSNTARIYALGGQQTASMWTVREVNDIKIVVPDKIMVLEGENGRISARVPLPEDLKSLTPPERVDLSYEVGVSAYSPCSDAGGQLDFLIKKEHFNGANDIWAYDCNLKLLWHHRVRQMYGHHNSVHCADVNGDGQKEVIAGGTLLAADGELIWEHDLMEEFSRIPGGEHYDAVLTQEPPANDEDQPIVFLIGGGAGVYVVDALTGKTLSTHHVGHAQWGLPCKMRQDLPGRQFLVGTRWGNFGILTLFSNTGQRLWTIQQDYGLQGSLPVRWVSSSADYFWLNTSEQAQGLYDGWGRLVHPLQEIRRLWQGKTARDVTSCSLRREPGDKVDTLAVTVDDTLHLFSPSKTASV